MELENLDSAHLPIMCIVTVAGPMRLPLVAYRIDQTGMIYYVDIDPDTMKVNDKADIFVGNFFLQNVKTFEREYNVEFLKQVMELQIEVSKPKSKLVTA
jgi:hypothetical protein